MVSAPWGGSNRKKRLPPGWGRLRQGVLSRDGFRCQLRLDGCVGIATEVDHTVAGDDHSLANLRAVCSRCHSKKSSAEGLEARRRKAARRFRPVERHPGVV